MTDFLEIEKKVNRLFSNIGRTNGTACDQTEDNREPLAYELFIADKLRKMAERRYEAAKADAMAAGLMGELDTFEPGAYTTFVGAQLTVAVRRNNPSQSVDKHLIIKALEKRKVDPLEVLEIMEEGSKERKGATTVSVQQME